MQWNDQNNKALKYLNNTGIEVSIPALEPGANCRKRFMIKLPPETLETLTVSETVNRRLPCSIMDTSTLTVQMERDIIQ